MYASDPPSVGARASRAAGYPSEGWVVWTFLNSLGENGFFSVLLSPMLFTQAVSRANAADIVQPYVNSIASKPRAMDHYEGRLSRTDRGQILFHQGREGKHFENQCVWMWVRRLHSRSMWDMKRSGVYRPRAHPDR